MSARVFVLLALALGATADFVGCGLYADANAAAASAYTASLDYIDNSGGFKFEVVCTSGSATDVSASLIVNSASLTISDWKWKSSTTGAFTKDDVCTTGNALGAAPYGLLLEGSGTTISYIELYYCATFTGTDAQMLEAGTITVVVDEASENFDWQSSDLNLTVSAPRTGRVFMHPSPDSAATVLYNAVDNLYEVQNDVTGSIRPLITVNRTQCQHYSESRLWEGRTINLDIGIEGYASEVEYWCLEMADNQGDCTVRVDADNTTATLRVQLGPTDCSKEFYAYAVNLATSPVHDFTVTVDATHTGRSVSEADPRADEFFYAELENNADDIADKSAYDAAAGTTGNQYYAMFTQMRLQHIENGRHYGRDRMLNVQAHEETSSGPFSQSAAGPATGVTFGAITVVDGSMCVEVTVPDTSDRMVVLHYGDYLDTAGWAVNPGEGEHILATQGSSWCSNMPSTYTNYSAANDMALCAALFSGAATLDTVPSVTEGDAEFYTLSSTDTTQTLKSCISLSELRACRVTNPSATTHASAGEVAVTTSSTVGTEETTTWKITANFIGAYDAGDTTCTHNPYGADQPWHVGTDAPASTDVNEYMQASYVYTRDTRHQTTVGFKAENPLDRVTQQSTFVHENCDADGCEGNATHACVAVTLAYAFDTQVQQGADYGYIGLRSTDIAANWGGNAESSSITVDAATTDSGATVTNYFRMESTCVLIEMDDSNAINRHFGGGAAGVADVSLTLTPKYFASAPYTDGTWTTSNSMK